MDGENETSKLQLNYFRHALKEYYLFPELGICCKVGVSKVIDSVAVLL